MQRPPIQILANIIQTELGLADGRVFISNQPYLKPIDENLFIVLQFVSRSCYYNNSNSVVNDLGTVDEVQSSGFLETYQIHCISQNTQAVYRAPEVIMALQSWYAREQQNKYSFRIFKTPKNFVSMPKPDGSKMINEVIATVQILASYSKINGVPFYETFDFETIVDY